MENRRSILERVDEITREHPRTRISGPHGDPSRQWEIQLPGCDPRKFDRGAQLLAFVDTLTDAQLDGETETVVVVQTAFREGGPW